MAYNLNWSFLRQLEACEKLAIPWAIVIGQSELEKGVVTLRHVPSRTKNEVARDIIVQTLLKKI